MKFNTYVINLQKDTKKWNEIQKNFKNTDIQLTRFNAIFGKELTKQQQLIKKTKVTKMCQLTCTDGIIGCGLSHIELAKHIVETDKNSFALVLEDDIKPIVSNFKQRIINLAKNAPKDWDLIKIHNHGFCKTLNNPIWLCGSTAGFLISKKGAQKVSNLQLKNHIDIQLHLNKKLKIYKSANNLLSSEYQNSGIANTNFITKLVKFKIKNVPLSWFLNQVYSKIPFTNIKITFFHLLLLVFLISYYFYKLKGLLIVIIVILSYLIIGMQFFS